jgi:hypothetical protein
VVERSFEPFIMEALSQLNFQTNLKYNKAYSCDFLNFQYVEEAFREQLEYHTMAEFNKVRGKEFIAFNSFHQVYSDCYVKKRPFIANYTQLFVDKLKQ